MTSGAWSLRPLTGRKVLAILLGFFGVIFAVNGVFLYVSLETHPGIVTDDAYRKGLHYNRALEEVDRQRALGWTATIAVDRGRVTVRMRGAGGAPLAGLSAALAAHRPASDADDRTLALTEAGPGVFRADGPPLAHGRWTLQFTATDAAGHRFASEHTILVMP